MGLKDKRFIVAFVGVSVVCYIESVGRSGAWITEKQERAKRFTKRAAQAWADRPPVKFETPMPSSVIEVAA